VPGTFDRKLQAIRWSRELNMPLQVNTLAAAELPKCPLSTSFSSRGSGSL
jgi:hypothetical protein